MSEDRRERPSRHGKILGEALALLAAAGRKDAPMEMPDCCLTCAFRPGCMTNQMAATGKTALDCVLGIDPDRFACHHGMKDGQPSKLCVGYIAATLAPWFKRLTDAQKARGYYTGEDGEDEVDGDEAVVGPFHWAEETPLYASPPSPQETRRAPFVSIKPMQLSDGRTDYFVSIKVGDREVTPHVFREEFKAAYHVALYDWLLNGSGEEPDVVEFGPDDWPALSTSPAAAEDVRASVIEAGDDLYAAFTGRGPFTDGQVEALLNYAKASNQFRSLTSPDPKQAMQDGGSE